MLFLIFQLGKERYALEANRVVEVVPLVELKKIPGAPQGVAGIFNYRGRPVPAVDLSALTLGEPARDCLSTRIIVINYPDHAGKPQPLGLIAEHATEMIRRNREDFAEPGLEFGGHSYLGPVLMEQNGGMIQLVREQRLLQDRVRNLLFSETVEEAS